MTNTQRRFLPSFILSLVPDSVVKEMVHFSQTVAKVRGNFDLWKSLKNGASQKLRMCCSVSPLLALQPREIQARLQVAPARSRQNTESDSTTHRICSSPTAGGKLLHSIAPFPAPTHSRTIFVGIHLQWKRVSTPGFAFLSPSQENSVLISAN